MDNRALLLFSIFVTFLISSQAKRSYTIELTNMTCRILDPSVGKEFTCILHKKRIAPSLSVRFVLKEQADAFNLLFDFSLLKKDNNNMNVGRHKIDGCQFLSSLSGSSIFSKMYSQIQKFSNIPKKCPVPANKVFEIRNYTVKDTYYPAILPALTHQLLLQIEKDKKIIADFYLAGSISY